MKKNATGKIIGAQGNLMTNEVKNLNQLGSSSELGNPKDSGSFLDVGHSDTIAYAIGSGNEVYKWEGSENMWIEEPGISAKAIEGTWAISTNGKSYKIVNGVWKAKDHSKTFTDIGGSSVKWAIGTDSKIYKWNSDLGIWKDKGVLPFSGVSFKRLDGDNPWVVGTDGYLYKRNIYAVWKRKSTAKKLIDIGVYGNNYYVIAEDQRVYKFDSSNSTYSSAIGSLKAIAISVNSYGSPWIIATDGKAYSWNGSAWIIRKNKTDSIKPVVTITNPKHNSVVRNTITIKVDATDNEGVSVVDWYFKKNGVSYWRGRDSVAPYEFTWNTKNENNGYAAIIAVAKDISGNTKESEITVYVYNYVRPYIPWVNQSVSESLGLEMQTYQPRTPYYPIDHNGPKHNYAKHLSKLSKFMDPTTNLLAYEMELTNSIQNYHFNRSDTVTWHAATTTGVLLALAVVQRNVNSDFNFELITALREEGYNVNNDSELETYLQDLADKLLTALKTAKEISGTKGLLARSFIVYGESNKPFPDSGEGKYWVQGSGNYSNMWYMMDSSQGIYNFVVNGLGMIKAMHNKGKVTLSSSNDSLINEIIVDCVSYLYNNNWEAQGFSLQTDEDIYIADMNGPNALMQISLLKAVSLVDWNTYYSKYQSNANINLGIVENFCNIFGKAGYYSPGRQNIPMSFSVDMQFTYTIFAFLSIADLDAEYNIMKPVKNGLKDLRKYMYYYSNYHFCTLSYYLFDSGNDDKLNQFKYDMLDFPAYPKMHYDKNSFTEDDNVSYPMSYRLTSAFYPKDNSHKYTIDSTLNPGLNQILPADFLYMYAIKLYRQDDDKNW